MLDVYHVLEKVTEYGFASHFAPGSLEEAVGVYRRTFRPSKQLDAPYVIAGINVFAADDRADAEAQVRDVSIQRTKALVGRGQELTDTQAAAILDGPSGAPLRDAFRHTAAGTPGEVRSQVTVFAAFSGADELITVHGAPTIEARLRSVDLLADVWGLAA